MIYYSLGLILNTINTHAFARMQKKKVLPIIIIRFTQFQSVWLDWKTNPTNSAILKEKKIYKILKDIKVSTYSVIRFCLPWRLSAQRIGSPSLQRKPTSGLRTTTAQKPGNSTACRAAGSALPSPPPYLLFPWLREAWRHRWLHCFTFIPHLKKKGSVIRSHNTLLNGSLLQDIQRRVARKKEKKTCKWNCSKLKTKRTNS